MYKTIENQLLVAERTVLRKILRPVRRDDGTSRIRNNADIEELVAEPNIIGETDFADSATYTERGRIKQSRAYLGLVSHPKYRWLDTV